jgi:hypothetical protein
MKVDRKPRPKGTGIPVMLRLQPEYADKIDDWRRQQHDHPNRPEAIRRLIELALKGAPTNPPPEPSDVVMDDSAKPASLWPMPVDIERALADQPKRKK